MLYEFFNTVARDFVTPLMEYNVVVYLVFTFIYCLLGGIDDELITLFVVQLVYFLVSITYHKPLELSKLFKIYLVISFGHLLDSLLKMSTSLRNYLILYYTYNSVIEIINMFSEDKKLKLPKQVKDLVKKLKKE